MFTRSRTPRTRRVLVLADALAHSHGHDYLGVEHLLLAILEDGDSVAAEALRRCSPLEVIRAELEAILASPGYRTPTNNVARAPEVADPGSGSGPRSEDHEEG
jgi:ATP-dependent Clp protease ATP-binding subunit ClpC